MLTAVSEILAGLDVPEPTPLLIPVAFWSARPVLAQIRKAAWCRARSADTVFHASLARVAAGTPHTLKLPPVVGSRVPLTYFAAVVGPAGTGKSSGCDVAGELVPLGPDVADNLPIGSGEGLVEVLFDFVKEEDDRRRSVTVKRQVRHNAFVYVDEAQTLTAVGARSGSTTLSTLRTAWTGGPLGQTNASAERKRLVPAGQYVYGLVMGVQPALAGPLLDDVAAGTPQRFAWCWGLDPAIPDIAPGWPGPLGWLPPDPGALAPLRSNAGPFVTHDIPVHDAVSTEIRTRALDRTRGTSVVTPLDAHADLLRLKVAALLGLLDGRVAVTEDDWVLAGMVTETSAEVRRHVQAILSAESRDREQATADRLARRQVAADSAVTESRVSQVAERIQVLVTRQHPHSASVKEVVSRMSHRQREVFAEALAVAVESGWIEEIRERGQGEDRRLLRLPSS